MHPWLIQSINQSNDYLQSAPENETVERLIEFHMDMHALLVALHVKVSNERHVGLWIVGAVVIPTLRAPAATRAAGVTAGRRGQVTRWVCVVERRNGIVKIGTGDGRVPGARDTRLLVRVGQDGDEGVVVVL